MPAWRHFYFDYESMEFFIFGCMAGEQAIIDAYKAGEDLHLAMSKRIYADEKQAKAQRQAIKTVDFAIIYGAGNAKIAGQLSLSADEAADLRGMYYRTFPAIPAFIKECDIRLRLQGYVEDWFGRKYHLREGYKAVNALVQGGCAQIFKIALLNIRASGMLSSACKIILPVHDEVQFARMRPASQTGIAAECVWARRIIERMTDIPQLTSRGFKLRVDVKYSDVSWAEKQKCTIQGVANV